MELFQLFSQKENKYSWITVAFSVQSFRKHVTVEFNENE